MYHSDTAMKKQCIIIFIAAVILGAAVRMVCAQDTTRVSRDVSIIKTGAARMMQVQTGQNYRDTDGTFKQWTADIDSAAVYVGEKIRYNLRHQRGNRLMRAGLDSAIWKFEYGDDWVVQRLVNPKKEQATWKHDRVEWKNALKQTDIYMTPTPDGVKEDIVLRGAQAPDTLTFLVEASSAATVGASGVTVGALTLPNPTAMDDDLKVVPVSWFWSGPVGGYYTVKITADRSEAEYPVTIDPTISVTVGSNASYQIQNQNAVYLTSRNGTTGDYAGTQSLVGQLTANYAVKRIAFYCPVPAFSLDTIMIDSIRIGADGIDDGGGTWTANVYSGNVETGGVTPYTAAFNDFDGWGATGAYTGTILSNNWTSAIYSSDWNYFVFNSAGEDTVVAHQGDTLNVMILSNEDAAASQPSGNEYAGFTSATMKLEIFYTLLFRSTALTALSDSSLRVVYDTTGAGMDDGKVPDTLTLAYASDSTVISVGQYHIPAIHGGAFTDTVFGLDGDSHYVVIAMGFSDGDTVYSTTADSERTFATIPTIDTIAGYSPGSVYLSLNQSQNHVNTQTAVFDSNFSRWITIGGDTTGDTIWYPRDSWEGIIIDAPLRLPSTKYRFQTIAKNMDSLVTSRGNLDSAWTNSRVKTITITRIDTGSFAITTQAETLDNTFTPSYFVAIDTNRAGTKDSSLTDTTTATITGNVAAAFTDTTTTTNAVLHPNQRIVYRLWRRDNADSSVYSNLDTFFTDPDIPTLDTSAYGGIYRFYSDTSFTLNISWGNNWTTPIVALGDSYCIAADCTRYWVYNDTFKLAADTAWTDSTVLDHTITLLRAFRPWPQNTATVPWMWTVAGDSVYQELKAHP